MSNRASKSASVTNAAISFVVRPPISGVLNGRGGHPSVTPNKLFVECLLWCHTAPYGPPLRASCAPRLTALRASRAPRLTPHHPRRLGVSL